MLEWAASKGRNELITAEIVEAKFGANGVEAERVPDVHTWDKQLFGLLAGLCEDGSEAGNIVQNIPTKSGLEAWKLLVHK